MPSRILVVENIDTTSTLDLFDGVSQDDAWISGAGCNIPMNIKTPSSLISSCMHGIIVDKEI